MPRKQKNEITEPVTIKGNHLTVTKHPNGSADLVWEWDALLSEVRTATGGLDALVATTEAKVKKSRTRKVLETVTELAAVANKKIRDVIKDVVHHEKVEKPQPAKKPRKKKGE